MNKVNNKTIEALCPLCDGNKCFIVTEKIRYKIDKSICKCCHCGLVFMKDPLINDDAPGYYEEEYRNFYQAPPAEEFFNTHIAESYQRIKKIHMYLNDTSKILEIGSATGNLLSALKDSGYSELTGIELDKNYSQYSIEELGLNIYQKPLKEISFDENSFDAILCFHVLEHFSGPLAFLKEVKRILRPSGTLIIEVPNVDDYLISLFKLKSYTEFYYQPAHNFYFSRSTLTKLINKAGFNKININLYQRHSFYNGINWLKIGKPSGLNGSKKATIATDIVNKLFQQMLILTGRADTIMAVVRI